jgi:hypothetical protein
MRDIEVLRDELALVGKVVEQTTWRAVRSVYGTKEAPCFWKQLSDGCRLRRT